MVYFPQRSDVDILRGIEKPLSSLNTCEWKGTIQFETLCFWKIVYLYYPRKEVFTFNFLIHVFFLPVCYGSLKAVQFSIVGK